MEALEFVLVANSPGELSSFVKPVIEKIKSKKISVRLSLFLTPCQYCSGREFAYAKSLGSRWWIWASIILGTPALLVLICVWMRRREEKEHPLTAIRIDITPPSRPAEPASAATGLVVTRPVVAKSTATKPTKSDDLKRIEGIGPKVAGLLQVSGITTCAQLAAADAERIGAILKEAGLPFIDPSTWAAQAELAAAGQWESLKALQAKLKGGRQG